jgi:hypothetical protein
VPARASNSEGGRLYLLVVRSSHSFPRGVALAEPVAPKPSGRGVLPMKDRRQARGERHQLLHRCANVSASISRSAALKHLSACRGGATSSSRRDARGTRTGCRQVISYRFVGDVPGSVVLLCSSIRPMLHPPSPRYGSCMKPRPPSGCKSRFSTPRPSARSMRPLPPLSGHVKSYQRSRQHVGKDRGCWVRTTSDLPPRRVPEKGTLLAIARSK